MSLTNRLSPALAAAALTAGGLVSCETPPSEDLTENEQLFVSHVKPVLEHRCSHCHYPERPVGGLDVLDRENVLAGDSGGRRFVVPGSPAGSLVYRALTEPQSHPGVMPGDGWGLTEAEIQQFEAWIAGGAQWPTGPAGRLKKRDYQVQTEGDL